eukprot:15482357-Alexandrium_andersonii.AAC.1
MTLGGLRRRLSGDPLVFFGCSWGGVVGPATRLVGGFCPAQRGARQAGLAVLAKEPAQAVSSGWKTLRGSQ